MNVAAMVEKRYDLKLFHLNSVEKIKQQPREIDPSDGSPVITIKLAINEISDRKEKR